MQPNPYESPSPVQAASRRHGILHWIALVISLLACLLPASVAVYAWVTHWHWQATGAYALNSFPMNKLAIDATWGTIACIAIMGACWGLRWIISVSRKRNK